MLRYCKDCILRQPDGICQLFREYVHDEETGCPKHTDQPRYCAFCGKPIISKGMIWTYPGVNEGEVKYALVCENCDKQAGACLTCRLVATCDFKTNPINLPLQVQKTIRQGNMVAQTIVKNPEREAETCAKNCPCWDAEASVCGREACGYMGCNKWEFIK